MSFKSVIYSIFAANLKFVYIYIGLASSLTVKLTDLLPQSPSHTRTFYFPFLSVYTVRMCQQKQNAQLQRER